MPPFAPAWADLGPVRERSGAALRLAEDLRVHAGVHDSSANFYRYQAAGLSGLAVVSTGTWIVALADAVDVRPAGRGARDDPEQRCDRRGRWAAR